MPQILTTADGSVTLQSENYQVTYHSIHGAVTESLHVFIAMGLQPKQQTQKNIRVLEMGLGTGLNVYLTFLEKKESQIHYTALETNPISLETVQELNYAENVENQAYQDILTSIHSSEWEQEIVFSDTFTLLKKQQRLQDFETTEEYDLIYYDAFAPTAQPELWTEAIFEKLYALTAPQGILVTYCAKGSVRRAMQAAGYQVERLQGPPGKREMLRASKIMKASIEPIFISK